jgi:hypothetical protein
VLRLPVIRSVLIFFLDFVHYLNSTKLQRLGSWILLPSPGKKGGQKTYVSGAQVELVSNLDTGNIKMPGITPTDNNSNLKIVILAPNPSVKNRFSLYQRAQQMEFSVLPFYLKTIVRNLQGSTPVIS